MSLEASLSVQNNVYVRRAIAHQYNISNNTIFIYSLLELKVNFSTYNRVIINLENWPRVCKQLHVPVQCCLKLLQRVMDMLSWMKSGRTASTTVCVCVRVCSGSIVSVGHQIEATVNMAGKHLLKSTTLHLQQHEDERETERKRWGPQCR